MPPDMRKWFDLPRLLHNYKRRTPLILVNGLAEQPESWFANRNHSRGTSTSRFPRSWSMTAMRSTGASTPAAR